MLGSGPRANAVLRTLNKSKTLSPHCKASMTSRRRRGPPAHSANIWSRPGICVRLHALELGLAPPAKMENRRSAVTRSEVQFREFSLWEYYFWEILLGLTTARRNPTIQRLVPN